MDKRTRKSQFLFHTTRQRTRLAVFERLYLRVNGFDSIVSGSDGGAKKISKKLEILLYCQILIQRKLARHVAHTLANFFILAHHVIAFDTYSAGIGQQK